MSCRKLTISVLATFVFLALGLVADGQTQIVLFGSSQSMSFSSPAGGPITASFTTLSGNAAFELAGVPDPTGSYSIGNTGGNFSLTSTNGGLTFTPGANSETFSFTSPDGDALSGTMSFNSVADNSPAPRFIGSILVSSVSGDSAFTGAYFAGGSYQIDFNLNLGSGSTLDSVFNNGGSTSGPVSSGEVPSPEPASMMLFGTGLLGLGTFLRRRLAARS